jgi:hypothetical protein
MLGEKIGEATGQVTGRRVIASETGVAKMETSFHATGTLLGVSVNETATYVSWLRPDGSLFGEGQGISTGKGGEIATWRGNGVGTLKKDGSATYRGAVFYQTTSSAWSRLNTVACVFEYEVDAQGHTKETLIEWR